MNKKRGPKPKVVENEKSKKRTLKRGKTVNEELSKKRGRKPIAVKKNHEIPPSSPIDKRGRRIGRRSKEQREKRRAEKEVRMIPLDGWKVHSICCGSVLIGPQHQVLVDPRLLKPHQGECICKGIWEKNCPKDSVVETDNSTHYNWLRLADTEAPMNIFNQPIIQDIMVSTNESSTSISVSTNSSSISTTNHENNIEPIIELFSSVNTLENPKYDLKINEKSPSETPQHI